MQKQEKKNKIICFGLPDKCIIMANKFNNRIY